MAPPPYRNHYNQNQSSNPPSWRGGHGNFRDRPPSSNIPSRSPSVHSPATQSPSQSYNGSPPVGPASRNFWSRNTPLPPKPSSLPPLPASLPPPPPSKPPPLPNAPPPPAPPKSQPAPPTKKKRNFLVTYDPLLDTSPVKKSANVQYRYDGEGAADTLIDPRLTLSAAERSLKRQGRKQMEQVGLLVWQVSDSLDYSSSLFTCPIIVG